MLKNYINFIDRALKGTENDVQEWLQVSPCLASFFEPESVFTREEEDREEGGNGTN